MNEQVKIEALRPGDVVTGGLVVYKVLPCVNNPEYVRIYWEEDAVFMYPRGTVYTLLSRGREQEEKKLTAPASWFLKEGDNPTDLLLRLLDSFDSKWWVADWVGPHISELSKQVREEIASLTEHSRLWLEHLQQEVQKEKTPVPPIPPERKVWRGALEEWMAEENTSPGEVWDEVQLTDKTPWSKEWWLFPGHSTATGFAPSHFLPKEIQKLMLPGNAGGGGTCWIKYPSEKASLQAVSQACIQWRKNQPTPPSNPAPKVWTGTLESWLQNAAPKLDYEQVVITNRKAGQYAEGGDFYWMSPKHTPPTTGRPFKEEHYLPQEIFSLLIPKAGRCSYSEYYHAYSTQEAAGKALSTACLNWRKNLPQPLSWKGTLAEWLEQGPAFIQEHPELQELDITDRPKPKQEGQESFFWVMDSQEIYRKPSYDHYRLPQDLLELLQDFTKKDKNYYKKFSSSEAGIQALHRACIQWAKNQGKEVPKEEPKLSETPQEPLVEVWEGTMQEWLEKGPTLVSQHPDLREVKIRDRQCQEGLSRYYWTADIDCYQRTPTERKLPPSLFVLLKNSVDGCYGHWKSYSSSEDSKKSLSEACLEWARDQNKKENPPT